MALAGTTDVDMTEASIQCGLASGVEKTTIRLPVVLYPTGSASLTLRHLLSMGAAALPPTQHVRDPLL